MAPRLLLVDDHAGFRRLAALTLRRAGFDIVGEAADGREAVTRTVELHPDIVVLDVLLPDTDGFDVARQLAALPQPPMVVLTSSRPHGDYGIRIGQSPVRGFVGKDELTGAAVAALTGLDP